MLNEPLGIIAGGGQFPRLVAESVRSAGNRAVLCAFYGHSDPSLEKVADAFCMVHLGSFNKVVAFFHKNGVKRLCMAGAINKPKALDFRPDLRAIRIIFSLCKKGDDSLLRAIISEFEREGMKVIPPSDLLPSLRCPAGQLTARAPDKEEWENIRYGWSIGKTLGRFDIGQCLVVRQQMVIAVECIEGTDATLRRASALHTGCIALKMAKPEQDERVDLPSIGLETIKNLITGKYRCLAVEAGKTLFFDMEESLKLADRNNLALISLTQEEIASMQQTD